MRLTLAERLANEQIQEAIVHNVDSGMFVCACLETRRLKTEWRRLHLYSIFDQRVMCCVLHMDKILFAKRFYLLVLKFWTKPNN